MKIKRIADLKRIPVGTRLRLVRSLLGSANKLRIVAKVSDTKIGFEGEGIADGRLSWLAIPKASDFESTENGFRIYETWANPGRPERREIAAEYVFES